MEYKVRFVEDDLMPDGHDYVVCRRDGVTAACVRASVTADLDLLGSVLEEAWAGYRRLATPAVLEVALAR